MYSKWKMHSYLISLDCVLVDPTVPISTRFSCFIYDHYCSIPETSLNLQNLKTLLKNIGDATKGHGVAICMNIPRSKLDVIKKEHSNIEDRNHACWELYFHEHPFPTWCRVAYALYVNDHLEELEILQKKYLKGMTVQVIKP